MEAEAEGAIGAGVAVDACTEMVRLAWGLSHCWAFAGFTKMISEPALLTTGWQYGSHGSE